MIEEYGIVKEVSNNNAIVVGNRGSMCGNCPSKGMCHPFGDENSKVEIFAINNINAKPGDKVKVIIKENILLKASFLVYGIPVFSLIIFSIIGKILFEKDIYSFFTGFLAMMSSFFFVKFYDKTNSEKFKPEIVEILNEDSCH